MLQDINRTCSGFSLLTDADMTQLVDPEVGYILQCAPSQTRKEKKTLVLDVDETILLAVPWTTEICIGDKLRLRKDDGKEPWLVVSATVSILRQDQDSPVMVDVHSQERLNDLFSIHAQESVLVVRVGLMNRSTEKAVNMSTLSTSYIPCFESFDELHAYNLRRPNVCPVSYMCGDLMVRLRPYLPVFLSRIREGFDVILFTAAPKQKYTKVISYAERALLPLLEQSGGKLWSRVLFREDCDVSANGRWFHKNIAKLGVDLSQIVIVDDRHVSFIGFEPNAIQIGKFDGSAFDDQLVRVLAFLDSIVDVNDVRYPICGLLKRADAKESSPEKTSSFIADFRRQYVDTMSRNSIIDDEQKAPEAVHSRPSSPFSQGSDSGSHRTLSAFSSISSFSSASSGEYAHSNSALSSSCASMLNEHTRNKKKTKIVAGEN